MIGYQALIRRSLIAAKNKAGKVTRPAMTEAEIQVAADAWKPGTRNAEEAAFRKAQKAMEGMTPDQRKALLAQLQAKG